MHKTISIQVYFLYKVIFLIILNWFIFLAVINRIFPAKDSIIEENSVSKQLEYYEIKIQEKEIILSEADLQPEYPKKICRHRNFALIFNWRSLFKKHCCVGCSVRGVV